VRQTQLDAARAKGYFEAMKEAGLEAHFSEIHSEDRELGYLAVKSLIANGVRPTALLLARIRLRRVLSHYRSLEYEFRTTSALPGLTTPWVTYCIPA